MITPKKQQRIATLGPKGTFSHEAVLLHDKNAEVLFTSTIWDVFEQVSKNVVDKGIVPIENSLSGSVGFSLDAFAEFDLEICAEINVQVRHYLSTKGKKEDIKYLFAHPQSYAQCEKYVRTQLRGAAMIPVASNATAAKELKACRKKGYGAIVPKLAMQRNKLKCIDENIQDSKFNVTRFLVLNKHTPKPTGKDKTSIAIYAKLDRPGLLWEVLGEFAKRNINLTKLESRPAKGRLGRYIFFIDMIGHQDSTDLTNAFKAMEKNFFVKILGSYPQK